MAGKDDKKKLKSRSGVDYSFDDVKFLERHAKYGDEYAKAHVDLMRGPDYKGRGNVPNFGGSEDRYQPIDKIRAKQADKKKKEEKSNKLNRSKVGKNFVKNAKKMNMGGVLKNRGGMFKGTY